MPGFPLALATKPTWGWRVGPFAWLLFRHRVPYAVVGGTAVSYYTGGERTPADLDLVIASSTEAAERTYRALSEMVDRFRVGPDSSRQFSASTIHAGADLCFTTQHGRLHVSGSFKGFDRDGLLARRRWVILDRSPLALCSLDDLLALKSIEPREGDRRDLALLRQRRG